MSNTNQQFKEIIANCKALFLNKTKDYGISWEILRLPSVTDQIYIKAMRVRSIQESGVNKVGEDPKAEFVGIINYCLMALMLWEKEQTGRAIPQEIDKLDGRYDEGIAMAWDTLQAKNHDYGEAWRQMRVSSITDLILMKLHRLKQIEDNGGETLVSEGVDANYIDMLNYAVFALILEEENIL